MFARLRCKWKQAQLSQIYMIWRKQDEVAQRVYKTKWGRGLPGEMTEDDWAFIFTVGSHFSASLQ